MNTSQCVSALLFPNIGSQLKHFKTSDSFICCSFHLKISVPYGFKTLIHSLKPFSKSCGQLSDSFPYFFANHEFSPTFNRWGGDQTQP